MDRIVINEPISSTLLIIEGQVTYSTEQGASVNQYKRVTIGGSTKIHSYGNLTYTNKISLKNVNRDSAYEFRKFIINKLNFQEKEFYFTILFEDESVKYDWMLEVRNGINYATAIGRFLQPNLDGVFTDTPPYLCDIVFPFEFKQWTVN